MLAYTKHVEIDGALSGSTGYDYPPIIPLFNVTLTEQYIGHGQNSLLELWTETRWKRDLNDRISHLVMGFPSVSPTRMASLFVRGAWLYVTKDGHVGRSACYFPTSF